MKEIITTVVALITALGGWEAIKYLLNRKTNARIADANAFKVEREALIEDYKRVQGEVDELKKQVAKLYTEIDTLKNDRLKLIQENNELKLALKEAEKRVCLRPDDQCLQRLSPDDHCRLRKILRGEYAKDHPDAIITEEDMKKEPKNDNGNEKD
jgi:regulator of replication initiation timing